ncbi:MerR family transcriptional regulator [Aquihabitans daechungensis]|uniref:MerR family transcriptional regulator n=1 Tax=Aquihabitans daechungensis TaxID=1052257 RepID=UPI003BA34EA5
MTGEDLTIDQLAAEVDMTVRNIRAHQARGLLPPPTIKGRIGYYGALHQRRLQQIRAMQEEGLNLAAIAKVVNDGQLTALTSAVFTDSGPAWFEPDDLLGRLGADPGDRVAERALELGLIVIDGERIRMDMPRLLPLAEEFLAMGVPLEAQLDALAEVQAATEQVAAAYLHLADEHLIARVAVDSGGDLEAIRESVARLRDLARVALDASFDHAMSEALRVHFDG